MTKFNDCFKLPRLYSDQPLVENAPVPLNKEQTHYLKSVLRQTAGAQIRVFNGQHGEWLASIETLEKKTGTLVPQTLFKPQPADQKQLHLFFAPIKKKKNMDFLIEKAVELGVGHLHPVITAHTQVRKINQERMEAQITEAAEQCERLDIPKLHQLADLSTALTNPNFDTPVLWAAERAENAANLSEIENPQAFLIGPEGGFNETECTMLGAMKTVQPISLGVQILRAETAAIHCLSHALLRHGG